MLSPLLPLTHFVLILESMFYKNLSVSLIFYIKQYFVYCKRLKFNMLSVRALVRLRGSHTLVALVSFPFWYFSLDVPFSFSHNPSLLRSDSWEFSWVSLSIPWSHKSKSVQMNLFSYWHTLLWIWVISLWSGPHHFKPCLSFLQLSLTSFHSYQKFIHTTMITEMSEKCIFHYMKPVHGKIKLMYIRATIFYLSKVLRGFGI